MAVGNGVEEVVAASVEAEVVDFLGAITTAMAATDHRIALVEAATVVVMVP